MAEKTKYDPKELERLWRLSYDELVAEPGKPNVGFTEARFVMQAKVALETRRLGIIMTFFTVVMAVATVILAIASFSSC